MEISNNKTYRFDNGNISICRHFGEKKTAEDLVKNAVVEAANGLDFLTSNRRNDIINAKLREPSRQTRRSETI